MIKRLLHFFMLSLVLSTTLFFNSCSKDDDKGLEYSKVTDWTATPKEIFSDYAILRSTGSRQDWGIYYSEDETKLYDFKYINQLDFNDWEKFEETGVRVRMVHGATNLECVVDDLYSNTTYYYIAFFYVHSKPDEYIAVDYTDIQSFTTLSSTYD